MWHSAKQKATWSPDARGARDGDSVRGACAFPYRNEQCERSKRSRAKIEAADRRYFSPAGGLDLSTALTLFVPVEMTTGYVPADIVVSL